MKKLNKAPLIAAIGTAIVSSLATGVASAEVNPFAINEMSQGYMQVAGIVPLEGAAKKAPEKAAEMKCGENMKPKADAEGAAKKTEGSCGEAKCGAMMDGGKMKEGMEKTCGAMMKGKEGACGAMGGDKAADDAKGGEMACGAMMKDGGAGMKDKDMEAACGAKM